MVYVAGRPDHKLDNEGMVDHIVSLVEARAAELEAAKLQAEAAAQALPLQAAE
jgi:(E)-4-hydroxy-3-methylbut-2-enyl-diphosphate synthase